MSDLVDQVVAAVGDAVSNDVAAAVVDNADLSAIEGLVDSTLTDTLTDAVVGAVAGDAGIQEAVSGAVAGAVAGDTGLQEAISGAVEGAVADTIVSSVGEAAGIEPQVPTEVFIFFDGIS